MVETWAVVVMGALTAGAGVARELVSLRRARVRRTSLENLIAGPGGCLRVVDRDAEGAVIEITTGAAPDAGNVPSCRSGERGRPGE
ncbi:hypothetical protein L3Q65_24475 [Amycolatopsis sp. FU40]|uniref:hypothetical protein n=1 Tax=Amycolatopsis sp. FU40 TaxID=2914159 RepID=UPI001F26D253|nr:hypothetical protein [Amycolatopsis sp. FU40]UKD51087.1 hypothetical protein L3Q65_24475 [Amycolatopsis sp. FU40]